MECFHVNVRGNVSFLNFEEIYQDFSRDFRRNLSSYFPQKDEDFDIPDWQFDLLF